MKEFGPNKQTSDIALIAGMGFLRAVKSETRFRDHFGDKRIRLLEHIINFAISSRVFRFTFNGILIPIISRLPYSVKSQFFNKGFVQSYDLSITAPKTMIQAKIDDAIKNGVTQIVNLSGGYDCGIITSAEANPQVKFIELDRDGPTRDSKIYAIQSFQYYQTTNPFNLKILKNKIYRSNDNLYLVACNLITEDLCKALESANFDSTQKTLFIGEGLTMFLPPEAVSKLFFALSNIMTEESEILLSILTPTSLPLLMRLFLKSSNELYLFTKPVNDVLKYLCEFNLAIKQKYSNVSFKMLDTNNRLLVNSVETTKEPYYVIGKKISSYNYKTFIDIPEIAPEMMKLKGKKEQEDKTNEISKLPAKALLTKATSAHKSIFFYATKNKFKFDLEFHKLDGHLKEKEWVTQAALWAESKWGYMRAFPGLEFREEQVRTYKKHFYIVTYANEPIGMFACYPQTLHPDLNRRNLIHYYLDAMYVIESLRGMGIGSRILEFAKKEFKKQNPNVVITLDTVNPKLNLFYEKHDAVQICEDRSLGCPTTKLRIGERKALK
ncbi:MAG: GNAT family N-acetyltransferase [Proteobacteria bacterium]|nr:GNAT family N-acetyltransferase [Pseudomonadota bacterium]